MSNAPFTAAQLNAWMHERHADTVADLAQRGLAMEFIDAQAGRPLSLRVTSDKAKFGFHLPVPYGDVDPMMAKARTAAPGFQQAFDGYESVYGQREPHFRPRLEIHGTLEDRHGWQLHLLPPESWRDTTARYGPWKATPMDADWGEVMARWTADQTAMRFMRWDVDLAEVVQDPMRSIYNPGATIPPGLPQSGCAFDLLPMGSETLRYRVWLMGTMDTDGTTPFIRSRIEILHPVDGSLESWGLLRGDAQVVINGKGNNISFRQHNEEALGEALAPEHLNITDEQAALFINMDVPIGMALARNITTEVYDFDFSMDDQATDSGLSL